MLKNDKGALPLANGGKGLKIAVVGPSINDTQAMLGNYQGIASRVVTPLTGIQALAASVGATITFGTGCGDIHSSGLQLCPKTSTFNDAIDAAAGADVIVFVGGLEQSIASEGHDWTDNGACDGATTAVGNLPGCQSQLVAALAKAYPSTPLILTLVTGSPMLIDDSEALAAAHLNAGYPGSLGGQAIAEALFGVISPGGRIPFSIPADPAILPPMSEPSMVAGPGRTYRYGSNFSTPFGYGLSYSSFTYSNLVLTSGNTVAPCGEVSLNVTVTNTGAWAGGDAAEVVQVYVEVPAGTGTGATAGFVTPNRLLRQFARVSLPPGVATTVSLTLDAASFALVNPADGFRYVPPGAFSIHVGGQQPGQAKSNGPQPLVAQVTVAGNAPTPFISCPGATQ